MSLKNLKKKLLYRANYRGTKEADIIIGEFVKNKISEMSDGEINDLDRFLELQDPDIFMWFIDKKEIDYYCDSNIHIELKKFWRSERLSKEPRNDDK